MEFWSDLIERYNQHACDRCSYPCFNKNGTCQKVSPVLFLLNEVVRFSRQQEARIIVRPEILDGMPFALKKELTAALFDRGPITLIGLADRLVRATARAVCERLPAGAPLQHIDYAFERLLLGLANDQVFSTLEEAFRLAQVADVERNWHHRLLPGTSYVNSSRRRPLNAVHMLFGLVAFMCVGFVSADTTLQPSRTPSIRPSLLTPEPMTILNMSHMHLAPEFTGSPDLQSNLRRYAQDQIDLAKQKGVSEEARQFIDSFAIPLGAGSFHETFIDAEDGDTVMKKMPLSGATFLQDTEKEVMVAIMMANATTSGGTIGVPIKHLFYDGSAFYLFTRRLRPVDHSDESVPWKVMEEAFANSLQECLHTYAIAAGDLHEKNVFFNADEGLLQIIDADGCVIASPLVPDEPPQLPDVGEVMQHLSPPVFVTTPPPMTPQTVLIDQMEDVFAAAILSHYGANPPIRAVYLLGEKIWIEYAALPADNNDHVYSLTKQWGRPISRQEYGYYKFATGYVRWDEAKTAVDYWMHYRMRTV